MACYKSTPLKAVHCGRKLIKFDANGDYETSDDDEIKAISGALGVTEVKPVKKV